MTDIEVITLSQAVETIKTAILQSQARAARNVSANQLALYFSVGGYISLNTRQQQWGSGAIETISERLQKELPGLQGFSERNIRNMRQFYETWSKLLIWQPAAAEMADQEKWQPAAAENQSPLATQLLLTPSRLDFSRDVFDIELAHDFLSISFTHHMEILNKTNTLEQRLFYIQKSAEFNWNKYELRDQLKKDLYGHQSLMPNNFLKSLPKHSQALKAIEMFKDEYLLDYINVEQLNVRDKSDVDEKIVEQEIIHNVKNFIMMFGHDFTFVGNQYHLEKFGENEFIDLLFYNRELACLVAVELKKGKFKPSYLGQLQSYLQILDTDIRKPNENPSIGIILCREANKAYVEFVIQNYDNPMGVATYKTAADMPEELRKALPDEQQLKELLSGDEK
jgi:predicted nuclease of restriction endonuclease-like (RecB) superfamily